MEGAAVTTKMVVTVDQWTQNSLKGIFENRLISDFSRREKGRFAELKPLRGHGLRPPPTRRRSNLRPITLMVVVNPHLMGMGRKKGVFPALCGMEARSKSLKKRSWPDKIGSKNRRFLLKNRDFTIFKQNRSIFASKNR